MIEVAPKETLLAKCFVCGTTAYVEWDATHTATPFAAMQALSDKNGWTGAKVSILCRASGVQIDVTMPVCSDACIKKLASVEDGVREHARLKALTESINAWWPTVRDEVFPRIVLSTSIQ